jgi:AcrR family transcriptional regulator
LRVKLSLKEGITLPPKVSFSREKILQQAFEIVRKDGLTLSARKIAQHLHCSTRPVYTAFNSMKALQEAVIQKAREYALSYFFQDTEDTDSPFLSLGLRYFRFAQEERELFKLLFLEGKIGITFDKMGQYFYPLLDRMKQDPRLRGLSESSLKRMGMNSWIYTHGLIALIYAVPPQKAEELIRTYITQMGGILIAGEYNHNKETQK